MAYGPRHEFDAPPDRGEVARQPPTTVAPMLRNSGLRSFEGQLREEEGLKFEGELVRAMDDIRRAHTAELSRQLVMFENETARLRKELEAVRPDRRQSSGHTRAETEVEYDAVEDVDAVVPKTSIKSGPRSVTATAWGPAHEPSCQSHERKHCGSTGASAVGAQSSEALVPSESTTSSTRQRKVRSQMSMDEGFNWRPSVSDKSLTVNGMFAVRRPSTFHNFLAKLSVNPDSNTMITWDLICGSLLIVVAVMSPFEAGFLPQEQLLSPLWVWNQLVNIVFLLDLMLQFIHPVKVTTRYGHRYVFDKRKIAISYLRSWFFVDLVSVIPFQLLLQNDQMKVTTVNRAARLLRLVKLLRLLRGFRIFRRWQERTGFSYRKNALYMLFSGVMLVSHWIACILGMLNRLQESDGCADAQEMCGVTWLTDAYRTWKPTNNEVLTVGQAYLFAMHTSMSILVHPHNYQPTNTGEMLTFTILMLLGGFIWTQVLSRSTALFASLERANMHYRQTMDDISLLSVDLGISKDLQHRLRKFFMNTTATTKYETWNALVRRMSPQLRRDVAREINKCWLMQIQFIARCSVSFKTDVSGALRLVAFADKEFFGESFHLYIMMQGYAMRHRLRSKQSPCVIIPGTAWGSEHLLLSNEELLEPNTAVALHFAQCQTLFRKDFDLILERYPEYRKSYRRCLIKCAFVRGIKRLVEEQRRQPTVATDTSFASRRAFGSADSAEIAANLPTVVGGDHLVDSMSRANRTTLGMRKKSILVSVRADAGSGPLANSSSEVLSSAPREVVSPLSMVSDPDAILPNAPRTASTPPG
eukprot:TRINITY_DN3435_c0_g5_i1.p1 TRINITY_DN3435_c0_g5~~TRINITY_DN3435_c0_g5_i1.p1  ORF type:complete len:813 (+),score=124.59 TRINITY_DN3435_c0_g5_i1:271-2709(+)